MAQCPFVLDEVLSAERGTSLRPFVHRCPKCGIITAPTKYSDPRRIRRRCRWFNPKVPGFTVSGACWCRGLGDVIHRAASILPEWAKVRIGYAISRLESWMTKREAEAFDPKGCAGCGRRRWSLNGRFPLKWFRRMVCGPVVTVSEAAGDRVDVCLVFPHGFGDAVQFTAILRHLERYRPLWRIAVNAKAGAHTLFDGLCAGVGVMDRENLPKVYPENYALTYPVHWTEPGETYCDSPATKVERCLREEFGIDPDPELWGYRVQVSERRREAARKALAEIAPLGEDGRFRVVALHYQGNSWKDSKNLDENVIRRAVETVRAAGFVPLILDWEDPYRSAILRERVRGVKCFGKGHPIWGGLGTGDGATLAAILAQVRMAIGIDSGPEHLSAAVGTETVVAWGKSHPVNYFAPMDNVVHLVRPDGGKYIRGDRGRGERFFRDHYRFQEIRANLRIVLPDLIERALDGSHSAGGVLDSRRVCGSGSCDRP